MVSTGLMTVFYDVDVQIAVLTGLLPSASSGFLVLRTAAPAAQPKSTVTTS